MTLVVERMAFGGKGVARLPSGKICFVPYVIPGERVLARVTKERSSYAEADLVKVLEASPSRVKAPCPVFGRCGGCQYQHISYPVQLSLKAQQVADTLRRLGGVAEPVVNATVASPLEYHYRNRVTVHAHAGKIGFYSEGSRDIVELEHCPIASEVVNVMLAELRKAKPREGEFPLREPVDFRGFRQVNNGAAAHLKDVVLDFGAPGGELLVDAYCGAGFFAKAMKHLFQKTVGIEWSADAIRSAKASAIEGEEYLLGDVRHHLEAALMEAAPENATVLLDPPAEGVEIEITRILLQRLPAKIIYVSCDPGTLARDIKRLGATYTLTTATPVDMFPQTAGIEVVAVLNRQ